MNLHLPTIQEFKEAVARQREMVLAEAVEVKDLMRILMKERNHQKWEDEDIAAIKAHLIHLAKAIPVLAIVLAPGGLILLPILAEILDRRTKRRPPPAGSQESSSPGGPPPAQPEK